MEVYEKADILHKKVVEIREEVLGKDHPDTAIIIWESCMRAMERNKKH